MIENLLTSDAVVFAGAVFILAAIGSVLPKDGPGRKAVDKLRRRVSGKDKSEE